MFLLEDRSIIKIEGDNCSIFLQNLITNDIKKCNDSLYSCILNAKGRFLYDIFLFKVKENQFLIDCFSDWSKDLIDFFSFYDLEGNITISLENFKVISTFEKKGVLVFEDTRSKNMAYRALVEDISGYDFKKIEEYELLRIQNLVIDGAKDLIREVSFPVHYSMDYALDFYKGCYLGQEALARVKNFGRRKMSLSIIEGNNLPKVGEKIDNGVMCSKIGNIGLISCMEK